MIRINGKALLEILDGNYDEGYCFVTMLASIIASRLTETSQRLLEEMAEVETCKAM